MRFVHFEKTTRFKYTRIIHQYVHAPEFTDCRIDQQLAGRFFTDIARYHHQTVVVTQLVIRRGEVIRIGRVDDHIVAMFQKKACYRFADTGRRAGYDDCLLFHDE
ncbi:hypothetical protein D3C86_1714990 [compost metagenome]